MSTTRRRFLQASLAAGVSAGLVQRGLARALDEKKPTSNPRKLLILGGTKFVGPALVEAARARGHVVTLFNRGKTNPELFPDVEKLRGDRDGDLKSLEGRKWDAVVDTSGHIPRIVKASVVLLAPNVKQYIFISSLNAIADLMAPNIDESAPKSTLADPTTEVNDFETYGGLKAACEDVVEAAMPGRSASVRPGLIVGPRDGSDRFTYWPVRVARGGEVLAPGKPEDRIQIIDVRDLGEFLVHMIENGTTGVFDAVGPDRRLDIGEMLHTCKVESKSDAMFTWVDAAFLAEHGVAAWKDMPAWLPNLDDAGDGVGTLNVSKAIKAGLKFRPLAETVRDTLAWWTSLPEERRASLRTGITAEREREALAAWHARDKK